MIVELPGSVSEHNIGRYKNYKMGFFHFSNNNLSIRKECATDLGLYDIKAAKSEDVDICFRTAQSNYWVAFREKGNFLRHKGRKNFISFIRQLWGWGYHVGYPYHKTGIKGIYVYWVSSKDHTIKYDLEIEKFPFLACLFLTDFQMMHLFLFLAVIFGFTGHFLLLTAACVACAVFSWRYLYDDRKTGLGIWKTIHLACVHYAANLVFAAATFVGGLKHGVVLCLGSIFRPKGP